MARTFDQMMGRLSPDRRAEVESQAAREIAMEHALRRLREMIGRTQAELAGRMGLGQPALSRMERKTDHYVSTLVEYVEALGGTVEVTARFPGREPVRLVVGDPVAELATAAVAGS